MDPLDYFLSLESLGMKFGLEHIQKLCAALDHPEHSFQSIIVAGTNGKGSVTAMVSTALSAARYSTARYTSPHLERLEERFVVNEHEVSTSDLRGSAAAVYQAVEDLLSRNELEGRPTFFEFATATAFELFRRARIEIAVLEVGLGGRLDATNVVSPMAAVITSIALDHVAQLGNSIASVAREKAGVIKRGIPVVCGELPPEAEAVIVQTCNERGARYVRVSDRVRWSVDLDITHTLVTIATPRHSFARVSLALRGRHQAQNAATAVALMEELIVLGVRLDGGSIRAGLTETFWPGRLERFHYGTADVLLDAAHNPAGARALADYLTETGWGDATLIFGVMRDKDSRTMIATLLPTVSRLICTTAPGRRALTAHELSAVAQELAADISTVETIENPLNAFRVACASSSRVVVAGSIFLLGPLRGILR